MTRRLLDAQVADVDAGSRHKIARTLLLATAETAPFLFVPRHGEDGTTARAVLGRRG